MAKEKKTTVMLPVDLLRRAQRVTGEGITPTLRKGLELVAARAAYEKALKMKGSYRSSIDLEKLREDR